MKRKVITRTINDTVAESIYCEGYKGDILIRVNDECEVYKIIYDYTECFDSKMTNNDIMTLVKNHYPDADSVTFHFRPGKNNKEIGKVQVHFLDRINKDS